MIRIPAPLRAAALALALGSLTACYDDLIGAVDIAGAVGSNSGVSVVLIDRSGSIPAADRDLYARSIEGIGAGIEADGRVLVAAIGDTDRSRFRTLLDIRAEDSDVRLKREGNLRKARSELTAALPTLLPEEPRAGSRSTRILETIAAASEAFHGKGGRLFILSDAIEESPAVNLARLPDNEQAIADAIAKVRAAGLLPDLKGVKLHIIGAGGDDTTIGVEGIRAFWHAYAEATSATLVHIGRLPHEPQ
jgi:hypothetical protein